MAIKNDREYRNLGTLEVSGDYVKGYASTFDPYPMYEKDGVTYYERIDRHAFDNADLSDVVFLREHTGAVYARTKNGSINLFVDDHGLGHETNLGLTQRAKDLREDIAVGNYSSMSFAFTVAKDHYEKETHTRVLDEIRKVFDLSCVAFPANPYTEIGLSARDYFDGVIEMEQAERLETERRSKERERLILRVKLMKGVTHGNQ